MIKLRQFLLTQLLQRRIFEALSVAVTSSFDRQNEKVDFLQTKEYIKKYILFFIYNKSLGEFKTIMPSIC